MNQPHPTEVSDWSWETLQVLSESGQSENRYLEYKRHLQYPNDGVAKSVKEWRRNVEREFTAFANANGGIIVFGMTDECLPSPFSPPEHECGRTVSQLVQNTTPLVKTEVSKPLRPPSDDTERVALAVRVFEADRKPVATSDSAYYVRINDQKHPMNREQIESLFVEADRKQQAIRQLEMEIERFNEIVTQEESRFRVHDQGPPDYHLLNITSLKEALRDNLHLYSNSDTREATARVFRELRGIEDREVYLNRTLAGQVSHPASDEGRFYSMERKELQTRVNRLEAALKNLVNTAGFEAEFES